MKLDDISNMLNEIADGVNTVNTVKNSVTNIADNITEAAKYSQTSQYQEDLLKSKQINHRASSLLKFFFILWLIFIVSTIILCITGNDVILRVLHI